MTGLGYSASISICLEIQWESSVFVSLCKCQAFSFTNVRNKDLSYGRHKKFSPVAFAVLSLVSKISLAWKPREYTKQFNLAGKFV